MTSEGLLLRTAAPVVRAAALRCVTVPARAPPPAEWPQRAARGLRQVTAVVASVPRFGYFLRPSAQRARGAQPARSRVVPRAPESRSLPERVPPVRELRLPVAVSPRCRRSPLLFRTPVSRILAEPRRQSDSLGRQRPAPALRRSDESPRRLRLQRPSHNPRQAQPREFWNSWTSLLDTAE
jgi:hypothetical protein